MSDIFELSDRAVELIADGDPIGATFMGINGRDHLWTDYSPAGHQARSDMWNAIQADAMAIETTTDIDSLAKRVLLAEAAEAIDLFEHGDHYRDLNNIVSSLQNIKDVLDVMGRGSAAEWANIAARIETMDCAIGGYQMTLAEGLTKGFAVARRQAEAAIVEARVMGGDESPFLGLLEEFSESTIDDAELSARLSAGVEVARREYSQLGEWLQATYLPQAVEKDACGRERYISEARKHLGMTIDIDETYAWGWAEVARLRARMAEVCRDIDSTKTVEEVVEMLEADESRSAGSVEEFIETMQQVQNDAVEQLAGVHFDVPEQILHVDVKVSPPGGALAPYYNGPSEDFSRPGSVWYPVGSKTTFPLWEEMSTAYHEGFPGHHLQVGVQTAMGDQLSRFHRVAVWSTGAGEGWALYAEHLMGELGFHDRPEYELGMLVAQLMRACRVVIDIGSHCELPIPDEASFHPGEAWTWDLAAEMLITVAFQGKDMAESEATRYLGWPGQAISYKIGEKVILELREELSQRDDFDLKQFHSNVLSVGSIGLELLQELVRAA